MKQIFADNQFYLYMYWKREWWQTAVSWHLGQEGRAAQLADWWWRWRRNVSFSISASLSLFSALTLYSHAHLWSIKLSLKMRVSSNELFSTLKVCLHFRPPSTTKPTFTGLFTRWDSFSALSKRLAWSILLMHHWRPCLKLRSAILIVLSTVVAKDANHQWWKKRDRIGGNWEAFPRWKLWVVFRDRRGARMEMWAQNSATRRPAFLLRQRARADSQGWSGTSRLSPVP